MSSNQIIHCVSPIYTSFKNCPDCGEKITSVPQINSVETLVPDLLKPLKKEFTNITAFTGIVISTHIYVRSKTKDGGSNVFEHAYCFLTLENERNETLEVNVTAEGNTANRIAVGDAVTILDTMPLTIDLPRPPGISDMINDKVADAFVVHKKDNGCYSRSNMSESFDERKVSFFETLMISLAIGVGIGLSITIGFLFLPNSTQDDFMWTIPTASLLVAILFFKTTYSDAAKMKVMFETYRNVVKNILDIPYQKLGYHLKSPEKLADDIFCGGCDSRLSKAFDYCVYCGIEQKPIMVVDEISSEVVVQNNTLEEGVSIKDKRLALMSEYECSTAEEIFEYHKFLGTTEKFTCSSRAQMYRVLNRSLYAKTQVNSTVHTTTTDYYSPTNAHLGRTTDVSVDLRTLVDLDGKILVEDSSGNIKELEVFPSMLGTFDVDDYFFSGLQWIKKGKKPEECFRMIQLNLTKNIVVRPYDIRDYGNCSFLLSLLPFVAAAGGVAAGIYFHEVSDYLYSYTNYRLPTFGYYLENIALGSVAFFCIYNIFYPFQRSVDKSNNKRAWKIVKPIFDIKNKAMDDEIAKTLVKYT